MNRNLKRNLLLLLVVAIVTSCGTSKKVADTDPAKVTEKTGAQFVAEKFLAQATTKLVASECMTAKMKFSLSTDGQNISVGGNLKMKRDDVIQMSLVAFGFVEAGRIEFTKDDVLFVDRINKRYVRSSYDKLDFLREAELNFYSLQALFRNEIFIPGKKAVKGNMSLLAATRTSDENAVISYQNKKLKFKFLTALANALVQQTQIASVKGDGPEFNWTYSKFADFRGRQFPMHHKISLSGDHAVSVDILLSSLTADTKWETRTNVKSSYSEVDAEDLLTKLLHL